MVLDAVFYFVRTAVTTACFYVCLLVSIFETYYHQQSQDQSEEACITFFRRIPSLFKEPYIATAISMGRQCTSIEGNSQMNSEDLGLVSGVGSFVKPYKPLVLLQSG